jgi:hypothetical protein
MESGVRRSGNQSLLRAAIGVDAEDTCEHPKYGIVRLEP